MPRYRTRPSRLRRAATVVTALLVRAVHHVCKSICIHRPTVVEALLGDPAQRCTLEREVRRCLRQLHRALGPDFPVGLAVIVQQTVATDHQVAVCFHIRHQTGRASGSLVRLALQIDGRRRTIDEILAALADACVSLADPSSQPGVLVPVAAATPPPVQSDPLASLRSDPLTSRSNGTVPHQRAAG